MEKGIIDNYRALPIGKYLDICAIAADDTLDDFDKQVKIITLLTDRDEADILALSLPEYSEMAARLEFLQHPSPDSHDKIANAYKLGDLTLIPVTDYRKMTAAQYIDFQTIMRLAGESVLETKVVEVLSCFMVPKGQKYADGYDVADVQAAIREHLSVADVLSLYGFFFRRFRALIQDSLNYSERAALKIPERERAPILEKIRKTRAMITTGNGDGSQTSTR